MWVGATMKKDEIAYWEPKLKGNHIMRVFPNSDKIPADAADPRYAYCKRVNAIPFISGKCDGDLAKIGSSADARSKRTFRNVIMDLIDAGHPMVYCTDHHEPEGDAKTDGSYNATIFKANFKKLWDMVNALPSAYRAKVKCGPAMTKQWTENGAGREYVTWDPGYGDFYAIDCYLNTWGSASDKPFTAFPSASTWLNRIKTYRFDGLPPATTTDKRPRILAELGAVGIPWDTNGAARGAWLTALHNELATWGPAVTGWAFLGYIWWNAEGTGGSAIDGVGQKRWFQFDRRHNGKPIQIGVDTKGTATTADDTPIYDPEGNYDTIANSQTLAAWNTLFLRESGGTTTPPGTQVIAPVAYPGTARVGVPKVYTGAIVVPDPTDPPPPTTTPGPIVVEDRPPAISSAGAFTVLVTDANLKPVAPPIVWQALDLTLKRNAVSSGVVSLRPIVPAAIAGINTPNSRLCVIRNPIPEVGIAAGEILMSGPIEKPGAYRWSADDEPAGALKVAFADNMLYLGERLVLPDPLNAISAQASSAFMIQNVVAESALRALVNVNGGPGSLASRRIPLLELGAVSGATPAGTPVSYAARLERLTDLLRTLALAGGDLTFRVRDTGAKLLFEVYPGQLRNGAVFSRQRGNLRAVETDPEAPTGTVAIVGGSGTGASRVLYEHAPASEWRRMEVFVNQSSTGTAAEMLAAAAKELADKGYKAGVAATAIDPFGGGYGTKYVLGDRVPVEDAGGVVRIDVVSAVRVQVTAGGPIEYAPTIGGDADTAADPATVRLLRELLRRVARTERI